MDLTHETFVHGTASATAPGRSAVRRDARRQDRARSRAGCSTSTRRRSGRQLGRPGPGRPLADHPLRGAVTIAIDVGVAPAGTGAPDGDRSQGVNGYVLNTITPETRQHLPLLLGVRRNYSLDDQRAHDTSCATACAGSSREDEVILEAQQRAIAGAPEAPFYNLNIDGGAMWARRLIDGMVARRARAASSRRVARGPLPDEPAGSSSIAHASQRRGARAAGADPRRRAAPGERVRRAPARRAARRVAHAAAAGARGARARRAARGAAAVAVSPCKRLHARTSTTRSSCAACSRALAARLAAERGWAPELLARRANASRNRRAAARASDRVSFAGYVELNERFHALLAAEAAAPVLRPSSNGRQRCRSPRRRLRAGAATEPEAPDTWSLAQSSTGPAGGDRAARGRTRRSARARTRAHRPRQPERALPSPTRSADARRGLIRRHEGGRCTEEQRTPGAPRRPRRSRT